MRIYGEQAPSHVYMSLSELLKKERLEKLVEGSILQIEFHNLTMRQDA